LKEVKKNPQAPASDYANLKNFYLLNQLNNKELKQISLFLLRRKFSKGEMLYKANFPHTVLYFVVEGEIKIFLENNGTEIELIRKKEYEHFGEIGLFLEMNRSAGARAMRSRPPGRYRRHDTGYSARTSPTCRTERHRRRIWPSIAQAAHATHRR